MRMRIIACLLLLVFINFGTLDLHHSAKAPSCDGYKSWYGSSGSFGPSNTTEFQQNLEAVLYDLPSNETEISLYGAGSYHHGVGLNTAYSKARCIGHIDNDTCYDCIKKASTMINDKCFVYADSGFLLYGDYCMVQYSNEKLFQTMQMPDGMISITDGFDNVVPSSRTNAFNGARTKLFNALAEKAKNRPDGYLIYQMFATGKWYDGSSNYTIYGASQCSPDLSSDQCTTCLDIVSQKLEGNFDGKVGGSIVGPSCNFRYDIKPFIDDQSVTVNNLAPSLAPPLAAPPPQPVTAGSSITLLAPPPTPQVLHPPSKGEGARKDRLVIYILSPIIVISIIIFVVIYLISRKKKDTAEIEIVSRISDNDESNFEPAMKTEETLKFDFRVITDATRNFSEANKLGQGGFGAVYKGKLLSGVEIAVKRLFPSTQHGGIQFTNEATLLANLQHNNLVKLRGYCMTKKERILIYEFMANSSLDHFIFDPSKRAQLKWEKLYKIIEGVARGLLYLHIDSRIKVIHLDLKSGNVLLDEDMTPKIADFGLARLFKNDNTHVNTSTIIGTEGYMAPEYRFFGEISTKSDVYSFGILLIEIVSGRRNSLFNIESDVVNLLTYAWKNWQEKTITNLLDPALTFETSSRQEMTRCIHIALLCAQNDAKLRPDMDTVVKWLITSSTTLPMPSKPPYFQQTRINRGFSLPESDDSEVTGNIRGSKHSSRNLWETARNFLSDGKLVSQEIYVGDGKV